MCTHTLANENLFCWDKLNCVIKINNERFNRWLLFPFEINFLFWFSSTKICTVDEVFFIFFSYQFGVVPNWFCLCRSVYSVVHGWMRWYSRCAYHSSNCHQYFYFRLHQSQWQHTKWMAEFMSVLFLSFYCRNNNSSSSSGRIKRIWEKCRFLSSFSLYKCQDHFRLDFIVLSLSAESSCMRTKFRHVCFKTLRNCCRCFRAGKNEYIPSCLWSCACVYA